MAAQPAEMDPAKLSELPSVPAPPGWTSDLDGPNPLKTTIITVTTVFMGLAFLFMGIRAYTKIKIKGRWTWDDGKFNTTCLCYLKNVNRPQINSDLCTWSCKFNCRALQCI